MVHTFGLVILGAGMEESIHFISRGCASGLVSTLHPSDLARTSRQTNRVQLATAFLARSHYSGGITGRAEVDSPVAEELEIILAVQERPIILIDDARVFDGSNGYLSAAALRTMIESHRPGWIVELESDIFSIFPSLRA